MIIGVPKEVMDQEYRVGLTPGVCGLLVKRGHTVLLQSGAGAGAPAMKTPASRRRA